MLICGVDCGLSRINPTGLAVVETDSMSLVYADVFVPTGASWVEKVAQVAKAICVIQEEFHPQALAYEFSWVGKNAQSTIKLAHVGGAVIAVATVPVRPVQPSQAKMALTGSGKATKTMMIEHARRLFGHTFPKDAADAIGVALAGEYLFRQEEPWN